MITDITEWHIMRSTNVGLTLCHCRRRWHNVKPGLAECIVFSDLPVGVFVSYHLLLFPRRYGGHSHLILWGANSFYSGSNRSPFFQTVRSGVSFTQTEQAPTANTLVTRRVKLINLYFVISINFKNLAHTP